MPLGYLCLVLHAHLPFVRHPEYDDFLEEDWLYEAITETYIPLLEVFDGLERDGCDWRLTMSVTPTLAAMLSDPLLQYRYVRHIDNLIALAGKEIERTRWQPEFNHLAHMYHDRFQRCRDVFVKQYDNNLRQRLPPLLRDRQAGDHHLRRHARLLAADGRSTATPMHGPDRDRLPRVRAALRQAAAGHLAAGVRLRPTASTSCCAMPASAISSPTRTASCSPSRGPSTASMLRSSAPRAASPCLARDTESSKQVWSCRRGLSRRLQLPRVLPRRRLRPRLRISQAAPAPDRHPQPPGHQVLQDHRPHRAQSSRTTRKPPWTRRPSTPATSCSTAKSRSNGCPARWTAGRR